MYSGSIPDVASINVIKYFHIILKKLLQVDGAVAEVRGAGTGCKSRSWSDFAKRPIGPRPETCMENSALQRGPTAVLSTERFSSKLGRRTYPAAAVILDIPS